MENKTYYERLKELKNNCPELTFNNDGYEYLSKEIKEKYKEQIQEIEDILKKCIQGFVRFDNFKPYKNDSFAVRVQYMWDSSFEGVGYFKIEDFKDLE